MKKTIKIIAVLMLAAASLAVARGGGHGGGGFGGGAGHGGGFGGHHAGEFHEDGGRFHDRGYGVAPYAAAGLVGAGLAGGSVFYDEDVVTPDEYDDDYPESTEIE